MSSDFTLFLTPQAERDLDDIYAYITTELKNQSAAANLIDNIAKALVGLESMPKKCPFSDIPVLRAGGYRKCVVKNYVALYNLDDARKIVRVVRVFYGMRDYQNLELF